MTSTTNTKRYCVIVHRATVYEVTARSEEDAITSVNAGEGRMVSGPEYVDALAFPSALCPACGAALTYRQNAAYCDICEMTLS